MIVNRFTYALRHLKNRIAIRSKCRTRIDNKISTIDDVSIQQILSNFIRVIINPSFPISTIAKNCRSRSNPVYLDPWKRIPQEKPAIIEIEASHSKPSTHSEIRNVSSITILNTVETLRIPALKKDSKSPPSFNPTIRAITHK